eukprot:CAMPEP_0119313846 /NCGR_PEP_ID=MMETSP1333-20130426/30632_1 /TAXON_ID=418940 /ORGANISM="Scyphosphaera apsteinii, Strain RCC1455" /LENGTH=289 /DNA_ID=CAMNT_0007318807 /DNA_START=106 /DNA_END=972 /DNA_ORIENTATION=+
MSNWNKDEVDALRADRGGGNLHNMATMFAKLPADSPQWPKKGCHPNDLKEFIVSSYNERRWYSDEAPAPKPVPEQAATVTPTAPQPRSAHLSYPPKVNKANTMPALPTAALPMAALPTAASPATDLLGLSVDEWAPFGSAPSAPATSHATSSAFVSDDSDWAAFANAPAAPPANPAAVVPSDTTSSWASFGSFEGSPVPANMAAASSASPPAVATQKAADPLASLFSSAAAESSSSFTAAFDATASPAAVPAAPLTPKAVTSCASAPANMYPSAFGSPAFGSNLPAGAA